MNQVHKLIGNFVICPLFLLFILSLWYVQSILVITTECYSNHHPISGEFGWQDFTGQVHLLKKLDAAANMLYSWLFHTVDMISLQFSLSSWDASFRIYTCWNSICVCMIVRWQIWNLRNLKTWTRIKWYFEALFWCVFFCIDMILTICWKNIFLVNSGVTMFSTFLARMTFFYFLGLTCDWISSYHYLNIFIFQFTTNILSFCFLLFRFIIQMRESSFPVRATQIRFA